MHLGNLVEELIVGLPIIQEVEQILKGDVKAGDTTALPIIHVTLHGHHCELAVSLTVKD